MILSRRSSVIHGRQAFPSASGSRWLVSAVLCALGAAACTDTTPDGSDASNVPNPDIIKIDGGPDTGLDTGVQADAISCGGVVCDDGNPCSDDFCVDGKCSTVFNKAVCNDGDPCTSGDKCDLGTCIGKVLICQDTAGGEDGGVGTDALPGDTIILGPELAAGDLVISEVMYDPGTVADELGEWFEIANITANDLDLGGLRIHSSEKLFVVPPGTPIQGGGRIVIGASLDTATNGGIPVDVAYGKVLGLANGKDDIVLESNGVVIDAVNWDASQGWLNAKGFSMSLNPGKLTASDNDLPGSWCGSTTLLANGEKGTPGAANDACLVDSDKDGVPDSNDNCPKVSNTNQNDFDKDGIGDACEAPEIACGNNKVEVGEECDDNNKVSGDGCSVYCGTEIPIAAGSIVITEIMHNPVKVGDDVGEWLELYNTTDAPIALNGLLIESGVTTKFKHVVASPTAVVIGPKSHALLARSIDSAVNGGLPKPLYVYDKVSLASTASVLQLRSGQTVVDELSYGAGWPLFAAKSMALDVTVTDAIAADNLGNWCKGQAVYGLGDFGSPGAVNPSCVGANADDDGDGSPDKVDNCATVKNPGQDDADKDGFGDLCDNCPADINADQSDGDNNGVGDVCEPPACGNGIPEVNVPGIGTETCDDGNLLYGDGCSGLCQLEVPLQAGDLVFSEIMVDPEASPDSEGEWLELYVAAAVPLDLAGLELQVGSKALQLPKDASLTVLPGTYVTIAKFADPLKNGGLGTVYALSGLSLANSATTSLQVGRGGVLVDSVTYNDVDWPAIPKAATLQLDPAKLTAADNDVPTNWCLAKTVYGKGDKGSPGMANSGCPKDTDGDGLFDDDDNCPNVTNSDQADWDDDTVGDVCDNCPSVANEDQSNVDGDSKGDMCQNLPDPDCGNGITEFGEQCDDKNSSEADDCSNDCQILAGTTPGVGDLVVSEIMAHGEGGSPDPGEWFEITNVSGKKLNLKGLIISGKTTDKDIVVGVDLPMPASAAFVFAATASGNTKVPEPVAVKYTQSAFPLANSGNDIIRLEFPKGTVIDVVEYVLDAAPKWPSVVQGKALQLSASALSATGNDTLGNWCYATASFATGKFGTPATANGVCGQPATMAIPGAGWPSDMPSWASQQSDWWAGQQDLNAAFGWSIAPSPDLR